jgi:hypothetical protein
MSNDANTIIVSISTPPGITRWEDIFVSDTVTNGSPYITQPIVSSMNLLIESFKYDSATSTMFGYIFDSGIFEAGRPVSYPNTVELKREGDNHVRLIGNSIVHQSIDPQFGEEFAMYYDGKHSVYIRLYPTQKLRDYWFAMYRYRSKRS